MSSIPTRRAFLFATLAVAALPLVGCKSKTQSDTVRTAAPYEGQYKNAKGEVVLEIKDNAASFTNPKTRSKIEVPFTPGDGTLFVESDAGNFTLTIAPDGSITGLPVAIAGDSGPLKKS